MIDKGLAGCRGHESAANCNESYESSHTILRARHNRATDILSECSPCSGSLSPGAQSLELDGWRLDLLSRQIASFRQRASVAIDDLRAWEGAEVEFLRPQKWSPREVFDRFSRLPPSPMRSRAYRSVTQYLLNNEQRKGLREFEVFMAFSYAVPLGIESADVDMLDPNSSSPPAPDIRCRLSGGTHFFELAEVIQGNIAEASSRKNREAIWNTGKHVVAMWDTLWDTFTKKLGKHYEPSARPRTLLLYYDRGDSYWECLQPVVSERTEELRMALLKAATFENVFLFDVRLQQILEWFTTAPVITEP